MKIVVLDGYAENPGDLSWDGLAKLGELSVYDRTSPAELLARCEGAEILYTNKTPLNASALSALPALRFIGVLATGYNVVDVAAAKKQGVLVANIPTYGTMSVAQYTFALILELCHHVGAHSDAVHAGEWGAQPDFSFWKYPICELSGKTLGVIGLGRIGQTVAGIAKAFGMRVLAYDVYANPALACDDLQFVTLDELLAGSDFVSLHCPLTQDNKELINRRTIARMKKTAMLINTARGQLVNEAELREALDQGQLAGAALDVVSSEPISQDNPLLSAPNCLLTPHIAWASREARERLMNIAVDNLKAFLNGAPVNIVNP